MENREYTRNECEMEIKNLLKQIVDVYHEYNPNGKYLSLTYINDTNEQYISFNNRSWVDGEDKDKPISCSDWLGKDEEGEE